MVFLLNINNDNRQMVEMYSFFYPAYHCNSCTGKSNSDPRTYHSRHPSSPEEKISCYGNSKEINPKELEILLSLLSKVGDKIKVDIHLFKTVKHHGHLKIFKACKLYVVMKILILSHLR